MANISRKLMWEPLRTLAFGSISSVYASVGDPMEHSIRQLIVQNLTDKGLTISFDGVRDTMDLASNTSYVFDITANKTSEGGWFLGEGESVYVKDWGSAPTTGKVSITTFYGSDS